MRGDDIERDSPASDANANADAALKRIPLRFLLPN